MEPQKERRTRAGLSDAPAPSPIRRDRAGRMQDGLAAHGASPLLRWVTSTTDAMSSLPWPDAASSAK
ncbi:MAG: hypothetical protein BroJett026_33930 [Betaproteobacteria bacterium]|nr:MAG: hypothetical protein BroJett026_33930 [Betaproteobacteria bacterium]